MGSNPTPTASWNFASQMNKKNFINITVVILVIVVFGGVGIYFISNRQSQPTSFPTPTPISGMPKPGLITVIGEITCLPKRGPGPQTKECAIGIRGADGWYYGLKNLYKLDPEYKFSVTGLRVEVSGVFSPGEMLGPGGVPYDVVGTIEVTSIKEIVGDR